METAYYSFNTYLRETFGEKIYKISLNGGMTCPNRDGTLGTGGCTFCSAGGSGEFTPSPELPMAEQIARAIALVAHKGARRYLAYFQAFTNTYAPLPYLRERFSQVLAHPDIVALSIATRPDCLPPETVDLLCELRAQYQKPIFVELGLQTVNDTIAAHIRRGYSYSCFLEALDRLDKANLPCVVHMILGLPSEIPEDMLAGISKVCALPIHGIKLQLLHILKGTAMEQEYLSHPERFALMEREAYLTVLVQAIHRIPPHIVIHRLTGDAPKRLLVAPLWSADKKRVRNEIQRRLTMISKKG